MNTSGETLVNTSVVAALMTLKGLAASTLANLVHVPQADLLAWLHDEQLNAEDAVSFDTQLEILNLLGVRKDAPRGDVVHYWRIHEGLFSNHTRTYWALQTALKAFGPAQAVYLAREADPALSFTAKAHFGLRFPSFMAILEVTAHPLRSISMDPSMLSDLSWAPDAMGVLLPDTEYLRLEPGSMRVKGLHKHIAYTAEASQWDKLRASAIAQGISAEQVASILLGNSGSRSPLLSRSESATSAQEMVSSAEFGNVNTASVLVTRPAKASPKKDDLAELIGQPVQGI